MRSDPPRRDPSFFIAASLPSPAALESPTGFRVRHRVLAILLSSIACTGLIRATELVDWPGAIQLGMAAAIAMLMGLLWWISYAHRRRETERDQRFVRTPDALAILESDGFVARANPAFEDLIQQSPAQGARLIDLIHPDDRDAVIDAFRSSVGEGVVVASHAPIEFRIRHGNEWLWTAWSITPDHGSTTARLHVVARDVSKRRAAEQRLESETAFRRAMEDSISTGMRAIDLEGRISYVNRGFARMLGYEIDELVGQLPPYSYWHPDDHVTNMHLLRRAMSTSSPLGGVQSRVRHRSGRMIDIRLYTSPLIDSQGRQTGWMSAMTDITEPTRIRRELASAHERFTTVLDELGSAVSVAPLVSALPNRADLVRVASLRANGHPGSGEFVDGSVTGASKADANAPAGPASASLRLLFANRHYRQLFGASGDMHTELLKIAGLDSQAAQLVLNEDGSPQFSPATLDVADGPPRAVEVFLPMHERWFEVRTRVIRWVDGQPVQLLVASDITSRHVARELQEHQTERLQQTSRLVTMGEMASSIAHELNQPLAAISNYTMGARTRLRRALETGLNVTDVEGVTEALDKTARQAQRAADVIRRIRAFGRRSEPERSKVLIDGILADAIALAEIAAKRQRIRIRSQVHAGIPLLYIDPILIEQVLLNLLKNGIEAMHGMAGAEITVDVRKVDDGVEFRVADQGAGVTEENAKNLFEPFFTTKREGMGIGLNICRSIVESHGGHIVVEPNHPHGTVFCFRLPLTAAPVPAPPIRPYLALSRVDPESETQNVSHADPPPAA